MRRPTKKYIILLCSVIFLVMLAALGVVYIHRKTLYHYWFERPKKFTGNIFGKPNKKTDIEFPRTNPQFTANISAMKSPSLLQQSITIYHTGNKTEKPVFQRNFYDDGFHGRVLTYTFANDSTIIQQSGSLGTIGCGNACSMVWSNFYAWNPPEQAFTLDNESHKDFFKQLLITYQIIDKRGCSIVGSNTVPSQNGISLTELYSKYPNLKWYCSPTPGMLPNSLVFFLKAEKATQEVIDGKNIGSNDIQDISL